MSLLYDLTTYLYKEFFGHYCAVDSDNDDNIYLLGKPENDKYVLKKSLFLKWVYHFSVLLLSFTSFVSLWESATFDLIS